MGGANPFTHHLTCSCHIGSIGDGVMILDATLQSTMPSWAYAVLIIMSSSVGEMKPYTASSLTLAVSEAHDDVGLGQRPRRLQQCPKAQLLAHTFVGEAVLIDGHEADPFDLLPALLAHARGALHSGGVQGVDGLIHEHRRLGAGCSVGRGTEAAASS
jgi:hypothetical protein